MQYHPTIAHYTMAWVYIEKVVQPLCIASRPSGNSIRHAGHLWIVMFLVNVYVGPKFNFTVLVMVKPEVRIVLGLMVSCIPSLCGKKFSQKVMLCTISMISRFGYCPNGSWLAIACTLSFKVLMSFYSRDMLISPSLDDVYRWFGEFFLICSNCPSPCICSTLNPLLWYICIACFIAMAFVYAFSFFINSAVQKCIAHKIVMTNGISFTYMMSYSKVTFRFKK